MKRTARLPIFALGAMLVTPSVAHGSHDTHYNPAHATETFGFRSETGPEPTKGPVLPRGLEERQNNPLNTCGFVDGEPAFSVTCAASTAECQYEASARAIGCCWTSPIGCEIYTACLPRSSSSQWETVDQDRTRLCSDITAAQCAVYSYMDPEWNGFTMHFCNSVRTTLLFYAQAFRTGELPSPSSSTEDSSTTDTSESTGSTTTGPISPPPPTPSPGHNAPVGAIVGGVIGGVAGIALLSFLAWFLLIRRKKNREQQPDAPPQPVMQQQQQYYQQQQSPPPGGDPSQHPPVMAMMSTSKPSSDGFVAATSPVGSGSLGPVPSNSPLMPQSGGYLSPGSSQSPDPGSPSYSSPGQEYYQQPYGHFPASGGPANPASELPVTRPDGEVRELQ